MWVLSTLSPPPSLSSSLGLPVAPRPSSSDASSRRAVSFFLSFPSRSQVKSFLYKVVDTTDIAELDLQVGDLELYVRRKVDAVAAAPPPAPVAAAPAAAPAPAAPSVEIELEEAEDSVDESAVYMTSEVVGIFRRGRYLKGKKIGTNAMVEVGDTVKKGQTIAFVEQMGTYTPVLAKQAGEISKFEIEEGSPIGYGQTLLAISPFFGGHIIGESKHV